MKRWILLLSAGWGLLPAEPASGRPSEDPARPRVGTVLVYRLAEGQLSRWTCTGVREAGPGRVAEFDVRTGSRTGTLRMIHTADGVALAWETPAAQGHWNPLVLDYLPAGPADRWIARKSLAEGHLHRMLGRIDKERVTLDVEGTPWPCRKVSFHGEENPGKNLFSAWIHPGLGLVRVEGGDEGTLRGELIHVGQPPA
ncbi:MAG: hypothetical protein VKO21_03125 [Candidatus Sericytochromatia bacterium]|nr:hypothetical protein [Candidatus Sericytochromatia bacterium]